jgi:hypothetical protein
MAQLSKIPYLETLYTGGSAFKEKAEETGPISITDNSCNPVLMNAVVKYVVRDRDRPRCLFTELPENLKPTQLFQFLDFLCIEKPKVTLADLDKELKNITTFRDKYGICESANRSLARDASVKLCWTGVELVSGHKEQSKLENMVLFILSHPRTFYLRLRQHTHAWYQERFHSTPKQAAILKGWMERCPDNPNRITDSPRSSSGGSSDSSYDGDGDFYGYDSDSD